MTLHATRADKILLLNTALGFVVGVHAFRTFVPAAVWNLADAWPLYLKGSLAVGVHLLGVVGGILITRHMNAATSLTWALAAIGVLRQIFLHTEIPGSFLSLLSWVVWLWWLASIAALLAGRPYIVAPAFALGIALQVGVQAAWHGLDLPMATGSIAIACAVIINGLFAATASQTRGEDPGANIGSYAIIAICAALFLEITFFANVGRVGLMAGLELAPTALLIQAGLIGGLLLLQLRQQRKLNYACAIALCAVTIIAPYLTGKGVVLLVLGQIAMVPLLADAAVRPLKSARLGFACGALALFILLFLFYNQYEWPFLWALGAAAVAGSALPLGRYEQHPRMLLPPAIVAVLLACVGFMPTLKGSSGDQDPQTLRILTYNIHQGFDAEGAPAMQRIAARIALSDADVIALQEVGRGWTLVGGADLIAYLKYRFPEYRIFFKPVNGQLWGMALMSRIPWTQVDGAIFPFPEGFRYGYVAGTVRIADEEVRILGTHMTAGLEGSGAEGRIAQTNMLISEASEYDNAIIVGDMNAHPDEPPIQQFLAAGYTDVNDKMGLGQVRTWPAAMPNERLDYVLVRGNIDAVTGRIDRTTASDHLPVTVAVKSRER